MRASLEVTAKRAIASLRADCNADCSRRADELRAGFATSTARARATLAAIAVAQRDALAEKRQRFFREQQNCIVRWCAELLPARLAAVRRALDAAAQREREATGELARAFATQHAREEAVFEKVLLSTIESRAVVLRTISLSGC